MAGDLHLALHGDMTVIPVYVVPGVSTSPSVCVDSPRPTVRNGGAAPTLLAAHLVLKQFYVVLSFATDALAVAAQQLVAHRGGRRDG